MSFCCSRAQQNGQKNQTDFGLLYPPSPRPSGRSPHRPLIFLVRSRRFLASEGEVRPLRDSPEASPSSPLRMIRSGLRSASAEDRRRSWAKGLLAGLGEKKKVEMKKGAGASPLFVIDAPKPVTESRIGSGHPGKPIL